MARKYLFICDGCGAAQQRDSECLPDKWAIITSAAGAFDVCSLACAGLTSRRLDLPQAPAQSRLEGGAA